jgi:Ca2+-binding EF-hand superfamily protein
MVSFVYSQSVPDEKILEMKTAFAKYDADGSGMLSNDEFRRIAPDMGVRHNSQKLRLLLS